METNWINAAVIQSYLDNISLCFATAYDSFYDMRMTEDNFDVDKVIYEHFDKVVLDYEQLPLLRIILTALFANYRQTYSSRPDEGPYFDGGEVQMELPF
ncbi:hypothetical protein [Pseudoalteromonas sp. T1lg48]|uniref:hypothetical protein n=1 Tax=Pseudoalteromonas sp. T1lg48 TaxID=2077100 RepID=UPI000CF63C2F|nr:hypothetical protein [Pseudoalteromonas sp. T1lg48]